MPQGNGFGLGSIDGRANLSNFFMQRNQVKSNSIMTFKCHKVKEGLTDVLYPVHDICFHPNNQASSFVSTCGGDGIIYFWDYKTKNKIT